MELALTTEASVIELDASQKRYRNLISYLPIPVWQIDARPAERIFDRLKVNSIGDLGTYLDEHPELVDLASEVLQVFAVNDEAIQLFGESIARNSSGRCGIRLPELPAQQGG